jgi:hypothetical protein
VVEVEVTVVVRVRSEGGDSDSGTDGSRDGVSIALAGCTDSKAVIAAMAQSHIAADRDKCRTTSRRVGSSSNLFLTASHERTWFRLSAGLLPRSRYR